MKNNFKTNLKLNLGIMRCSFWNCFTHVAIKVAAFAQNKSVQAVKKNLELVNEITKDGCSPEIDTLLKNLQEIEL